MHAYFDTSAVVPLFVDEPTSDSCRSAWNAADLVATSAMTYVEVHAAFAQAARLGRMTAAQHREAVDEFSKVWDSVVVIGVTDAVIHHGATLAASQSLRGYDAVHCASAVAAASDDFVAVSGDKDLLRAWSELGVPTVDTAG